jgi:hypothetical protein
LEEVEVNTESPAVESPPESIAAPAEKLVALVVDDILDSRAFRLATGIADGAFLDLGYGASTGG